MTCRAATNATTCAGGTPTGNVLTYDNEGRLSGWQNTPSSPTTTAAYLYDGEGNRVEQQVTTSGAATSTVYVAGGSEEATTSGGTTTLTKYFSGAAGLPTAERIGTNGPLSYLATDGQGTVSETLDASGNATSQALYGPYGTVRYTSGTSPTTRGYTGQRVDGVTGLDYYQARYYDPVAGQFVSADSVAAGLNRYGYVGGNPTTATDPTGHSACVFNYCWINGGGSTDDNTPYITHIEYYSHEESGYYTEKDGLYHYRIATQAIIYWSDGSHTDGGWSESPEKTRCDNKCGWYRARNTAIEDMRHRGLVLSITGLIADFIGAAAVSQGESVVGSITEWAKYLTLVLDILSFAATFVPDLAAQLYDFASNVQQVLALVHNALAIIRLGSWEADLALNAALIALKGLPYVATSLAIAIVGEVIQMVSQVAIANAVAIAGDIARQQDMSIEDWCSDPGKGQCNGF